MLAPGRYPQWRSCFLRYVDTRPNGEALRICVLSGPYKPTTVLVQAVDATDDSPAAPEHTTVKTPMNMSPENKAHFLAKKKVIHLILTGIEMTFTRLSHISSAPSPKPSIPSRSYTTTRHKGKEIAKPITPLSGTASEEDIDPEQAQRDKDMQKNLAYIAKYFKKIYKPTNNNLRTSSNSKNKNVDTTTQYKNDDHSRQFGTQRRVNVVAARENVGSKVVQQSGIQCFNCREFGHFAKECRKPKRVKDSAYHKEKMLLCKQAEQGVLLQAKQYDWLADRDEEVDEQELEAHYSYMAKIQEVSTADSGIDSEPVEQTKQVEFEKYKAFNDRTIDYDKLEQIDELESDKAEFSDMYDVILQECVSKDVMCSYMQSLSNLDALVELQCMYLHKVKECNCLAQKLSKQTDSVSKK
nr:hypothetical protein [Tanacetum cinerariifolium]